jgi:hypothetical protein
MNISGSFTVATALPPNFPGQDITSLLTAYSFFDGINTYTNTNPNSRIFSFFVATNGSSQISTSIFLLQLWQSGTSPHSIGNRVALISSFGSAGNNSSCTSVGASSFSGASDVCLTNTPDTSTSLAAGAIGTWTGGGTGGGTPPTTVPTLGEWGMIILTGLLVGFAWLRLRRQDRLTPGI